MRQTLAVERVVPWEEFNDTEAQIDGRLDGHAVSCHVLLYGAEWERPRAGEPLEADITLVRYGDVTLTDAPAALTRVNGVNFVAVGTVVGRDGDLVRLDSVLPLEVDLDTTPGMQRELPPIGPGDTIRVEGTFELELPDD